jgi:hypothetical protein
MPMAVPERHRFARGMSTPASDAQVAPIDDHKPRAASAWRAAGPAIARCFE